MRRSVELSFLACFLVSFSLGAQYSEKDWEDRDVWMQPERIIRQAGVEPGDAVADVGCHEGYLSMHLAEAVGASGRVFAVDIREDRLERLQQIALQRDYGNIKTVVGEYDDPKLPEAELDVVFIVDAYHEMDEYMRILAHVKKSLKPGGRVVILEKLKDHARHKSREQQVQSHTLAPGFVKNELEQVGFTVVEEYNDLGHWDHENGQNHVVDYRTCSAGIGPSQSSGTYRTEIGKIIFNIITMKKETLLIVMFILGSFMLTAQSKAEKKGMKEAKAQVNYEGTKALIESGEYEFFADRMISSTGFSNTIVTTRNKISVNGDSAIIYLPYFGEVRANSPYQVDGGIKYEGQLEDYEVEFRDNKRRIIVQFSIDRGIEEHNFIMTINKDGYTRVTVISSGRTSISYHGITSPPEEAASR